MTRLRCTAHNRPVIELMRVALRAIGVVLPGAGAWVWVVLHGGPPGDGFGEFLGAMALSLLASTLWAAIDALRAPIRTVLIRWIATAFVVGGGLALAIGLLEPDSFVVSLAQFFARPLLMAAGLGVAVGAVVGVARDRLRGRHEDTGSPGTTLSVDRAGVRLWAPSEPDSVRASRDSACWCWAVGW